MDQPKIERLLRLMRLMSGTRDYSIEELGDLLDISYRTIYRYIDTFKAAGFAVEKAPGNIYKLVTMNHPGLDLSKIVYFSEEEAYMVNRLIDNLDNTNALKQGLHKKLSAIYDATSLADYIDNKDNSANIQALANAIKKKKKAILRSYESAHSGKIRDRMIEPFTFTTNYIDIWAFDLEDGQNKRFKIARIDHVDILDESWTEEAFHRGAEIDVFRMSGPTKSHVRLKMTLRAKRLLIEEYPLAEKNIRKNVDSWIFDADVYAMEGVGRFYLGLASEIEIVEGNDLKEYIRSYVSEHLSSF